MLEWMILPFKRYFDFQGRSRRMEYWSFFLLNMIVYLVFGGIMMAGGFSLAEMDGEMGAAPPELGAPFYLGAGLLGLYALAVFIPNLAVNVRRLHDRDMSGWWLLGLVILSAVPVIGIIVSIGWLVLMFLPGTPGANRFGPDPKDPAGAEVFS